MVSEKTVVTLFTKNIKMGTQTIDVTLNRVPIPQKKSQKILGVTFDIFLCFSAHVESIISTCAKKINFVKAFLWNCGGIYPPCIGTLYKQYVEPTIGYACAAWGSNLSATNLTKIQEIQSRAKKLLEKYTDKEIAPRTLESIIEATGGNFRRGKEKDPRPYRKCVGSRSEHREKMARLLRDAGIT